MAIKQLSVFIENQQGKLVEIMEILSKSDISVRAISVADTTEFGILRLIVNRPNRAERTLKEQGFAVSLSDVMGICIDDRPGALCEALKLLSDAQIAVEYVYAFLNNKNNTAYVILRVEGNDAAYKALQAGGVSIVDGTDIE